MNIQFVVNLRPDTTNEEFLHALALRGWLAAPDNITAALRDKIPNLLGSKRWLFADNGNYSLIGQVASSYEVAATKLLQQISQIEDRVNHSLKRNELPEEIQLEVANIVEHASEQAKEVQRNHGQGEYIKEQIVLHPTHLIGVEDITAAVFLRLGLDFKNLPYDHEYLRERNRSVAKTAQDIYQELPLKLRRYYYPVASALDYDSAFDAGCEFAMAGHQCMAMGFGAFMSDDTYTDGYLRKNDWINLKKRIPNRYLRTTLVARGFFDGYKSVSGSMPLRFHFLGLGAPIMMAIVARAAWGVSNISFDATSPIKDAAERTIYVNRPAYLKIRTWRVAQRLVEDRRMEWRCPCDFCKNFVNAHPFDYLALRTLMKQKGRKVTPEDLRQDGMLFSLAPLLSEPNGGLLRQVVTAARMGHNHWALLGICRQLSRVAKTEQLLDEFVSQIVEAYVNNTSGESFAEAVQIGFQISRDTAG